VGAPIVFAASKEREKMINMHGRTERKERNLHK
jgi:hypothetical protein